MWVVQLAQLCLLALSNGEREREQATLNRAVNRGSGEPRSARTKSQLRAVCATVAAPDQFPRLLPPAIPFHRFDGRDGVQESVAGKLGQQEMGELFFLLYSPFWIIILLGVVVPLKLYETFHELEYLILGLLTVTPCFLFPLVVVCKEDAHIPWYNRYWFKANLWIAIFGFVGNYFWTHYFYTVLGAIYTFPSYKINHVPIPTFLLTQPYFLLYHAISNMTLRRLEHAIKDIPSRQNRWLIQAGWVLVLSYVTALTEALTISHFPYYEMVDRNTFYAVGSFFYGIYFVVSFPMFKRIDEDPLGARWTLSQVAVDALGASMLVTIILDFWRITIGPIVDVPWAASLGECVQFGPPWLRPPGVKSESWKWTSSGVTMESYGRSKLQEMVKDKVEL